MAVWKPCRSPGSSFIRPALFLDRDGVVIMDRDYLSDPDQVELLPGVPETMKAAAAAGYLLIGISNQSGLGRGMFTIREFTAVMNRLDDLLAQSGTGFDGFYYCPHSPEDGCECRKPKAGLLAEAGETCSWNAAASWVVGDKTSDVALGRGCEMGSVLVRTGHGAAHEREVGQLWENDPKVLIAEDLPAAFAAVRRAQQQGPDQ